MSADKSKFSKYILNADGEVYTPLFLTEYVSLAKFKELFHCDLALTTVDADGKSCIQGAVIKDSENYKMHNPKRLSHLCVAKRDGQTAQIVSYQLLNDGGLNTLGRAEITSITNADAVNDPNSDPTPKAGDVIVIGKISTSYYGNCRLYFDYIRNNEPKVRVQIGDIFAQNTITDFHKNINLRIGNYLSQIIVENEEGEWNYNLYPFTVEGEHYTLLYGQTLQEAINNSHNPDMLRQVYISEGNIAVGSVFYTDSICMTPVEVSGYYINLDKYYLYGEKRTGYQDYQVLETGRIKELPSSSPNYYIYPASATYAHNVLTQITLAVMSTNQPADAQLKINVQIVDSTNLQVLAETSIDEQISIDDESLNASIFYPTASITNIAVKLVDNGSANTIELSDRLIPISEII